MRNRPALVGLLLLLVAAAPLAARTTRRACIQACGALVADCNAQHARPRARKRCRATLIAMCRKHGVATCEPPSTTTTTTTGPGSTTTTACGADGQACATGGDCCSGVCDPGTYACVAARGSTTSTSSPLGSTTTSTMIPQCEPVPCDLNSSTGCCQDVAGSGLCCPAYTLCNPGSLCCCSGVCIDGQCTVH